MSAKKTPKPPSQTRRGATAIVKRLREAGHDAFFVGGAVRDTLLGRTIREFDIATRKLIALSVKKMTLS